MPPRVKALMVGKPLTSYFAHRARLDDWTSRDRKAAQQFVKYHHDGGDEGKAGAHVVAVYSVEGNDG